MKKHGGKRPGAGRKTLSASDKRKRFNSTLFSPNELKKIRKAAKTLEVSVNKFVRDSALWRAQSVLDLPADQVL